MNRLNVVGVLADQVRKAGHLLDVQQLVGRERAGLEAVRVEVAITELQMVVLNAQNANGNIFKLKFQLD